MEAQQSYFVYVLQNSAGRFYIGMSDDVQVRLQQHNAGVPRWTKHRGRLGRMDALPNGIRRYSRFGNLRYHPRFQLHPR